MMRACGLQQATRRSAAHRARNATGGQATRQWQTTLADGVGVSPARLLGRARRGLRCGPLGRALTIARARPAVSRIYCTNILTPGVQKITMRRGTGLDCQLEKMEVRHATWSPVAAAVGQ